MSYMMLEIYSCFWKIECTKQEGNGEPASEFHGTLGKEPRPFRYGNPSLHSQISLMA